MRQEVPDRQDARGASQGGPPQPEAILLQTVRLQSRTESFPDRAQSLGARRQQAVRLRVVRLQDNVSKHSQRAQTDGKSWTLSFIGRNSMGQTTKRLVLA